MMYSPTKSKEAFHHGVVVAIALCRRRIDAAVNLYGEGMIDYEDYTHRIENNRREMAHWEASTTETQRLGIELEICMKSVNEMARLWDVSSDEGKQGLVRKSKSGRI